MILRYYDYKEEARTPRKLVGILFFIYTTMDSHNRNNDYTDPLFIKTAELEDYLDKIFWESPWKNY